MSGRPRTPPIPDASAAGDPQASPSVLPGVGAKRAEQLAAAGYRGLVDLAAVVPRRLLRWPGRSTLEQALASDGREVRVRGAVQRVDLVRFGGKRSKLTVVLADGSGDLDLVWFNQPWWRERFRPGEEVECLGVVVRRKGGPVLEVARVATDDDPFPVAGTLECEYDAPKGFSSPVFGRLCALAAEACGPALRDPLPVDALAHADLPDLATAVRNLHTPTSRTAFEASRRRLVLEPLLAMQAGLALRRAGRGGGQARAVRLGPATLRGLLAALPFRLTAGQARVWDELLRDLGRRVPMRRLLQGDVGTGKTVLAALACQAVVEGGGQAAFMAPTELLAEQHHYGLKDLLHAGGVTCALLSASTPKDERRDLLRRLARGELDVLIGTHALFSADVRFRRLDLCVIDEQHRFGVSQRAKLADKGRDVHLLLMTATPIPRTLALTVYGDLDVSTLREAPPGRGEVRTRWVRGAKRRSMLTWIGECLADGEQVYWVCPRIGGDGEDSAEGAVARFEKLAAREATTVSGIELVHGKLPSEERASRLDRFRRGDVGLLVATTVIEVGVDVPDATVIVIEGAEKLGLAQLHQLRGRVGRGTKDGWCFLLGAESGRERFEQLERTRDGFLLAERDLEKRGMGDLAGLRQSGHVGLGGAEVDPERDLDLVLLARDLMRADPGLARRYAPGAGPRLTP